MKKTIKIEDFTLLLLTFKSIYSFSSIIYSSVIDNFILIFAMSCFAIVFIKRKYTYKEFIIILLLGIVLTISSLRAGMWYMLITYVVAVLMSKMDIDRSISLIAKVQFWFLMFHMIISIGFYCLGKSGLVVNFYGENRLTLLFTHPNILSMLCISLILEWTWLKWDKITIYNMVFIIFIMILLYLMTKTDAILIILIIEYATWLKNKYINFAFNVIAKIGVPIATLICWLISYIYTNVQGKIGAFVKLLDTLMSKRISILAMEISMNKIKLFGNGMKTYSGYNFEFGVFGTNAIDNVYYTLIFFYGFIFIIILSIIFYKLAKLNSCKIDFFLTAFVVYGLVEGQIIISLVFPALLLITFLFKDKKIIIDNLNKNN